MTKTYTEGVVQVRVPDHVFDWPAHVKEIERKVHELNALIFSLETGNTEPWT